MTGKDTSEYGKGHESCHALRGIGEVGLEG